MARSELAVVVDRDVLRQFEHDRPRCPGQQASQALAGTERDSRRHVHREERTCRKVRRLREGRLDRGELVVVAQAKGRGLREPDVRRRAVAEPGQRLETDHPAGLEGHDRLEDRVEGAGRQFPLQPRADLDRLATIRQRGTGHRGQDARVVDRGRHELRLFAERWHRAQALTADVEHADEVVACVDGGSGDEGHIDREELVAGFPGLRSGYWLGPRSECCLGQQVATPTGREERSATTYARVPAVRGERLEPVAGNELEHADERRLGALGDFVHDRFGGCFRLRREGHVPQRRDDAGPNTELIGDPSRPGRVTAQVRANPGDEFVQSYGLRKEVVRPGVEALDHALAGPRAGHQQDRQRQRLRPGAQGTNHVRAGHRGQAHVEDDHVDPAGLDEGDRGLAAVGLQDVEPAATQGDRDQTPEIVGVVDDQDARRRSCRLAHVGRTDVERRSTADATAASSSSDGTGLDRNMAPRPTTSSRSSVSAV